MTNAELIGALQPTEFLDYKHPLVQDFVKQHIGNASNEIDVALRLYYTVRDEIRYDPYSIDSQPESFRASTTLLQGTGWCVPKAILLAACYRAKGIPARLGYADVKNHLSSQRLRESMKTDVFAWHGYTSVLLNNQWVKATPAFNKELCEKANIHPLEFNGLEDSIYHEFDRAGQRHMEYLRHHGEFDDLPLATILQDFEKLYGMDITQKLKSTNTESNFADEVSIESTI